MTLHRDPQDRLDAIERRLNKESLDDELRLDIEREMQEIHREFASLQSKLAFDKHLAAYVTDQYKKRQNGDRGPLCSCNLATCPLSNGKIPAKVRYNPHALSPQQGGRERVLQYVQKHRGGEVLHEVLDTWDDREGQLHKRIASILSKLTQEEQKHLREVPTK